jgi:hypothetical protein
MKDLLVLLGMGRRQINSKFWTQEGGPRIMEIQVDEGRIS